MRAFLARVLFIGHAVLAVWVTVTLTDKKEWWFLVGVNLLFAPEMYLTLHKRSGDERKWVCLCIIVYLADVLPPIWFAELDRLDKFNDTIGRSNNLNSLVPVNGLKMPIKMTDEIWLLLVEQSLMLVLVVCRWLLPRGPGISRDQLSLLLLVYMGIVSDNMELCLLFDEPQVRNDRNLTFIVLGVWSLSFLQFAFVLTATRDPHQNRIFPSILGTQEPPPKTRTQEPPPKTIWEVAFTTEIWSLLLCVSVQDAPFAATRIYAMIKYDLFTYSIIFFICKNVLVVFLVVYRLVILVRVHRKRDEFEGIEFQIPRRFPPSRRDLPPLPTDW